MDKKLLILLGTPIIFGLLLVVFFTLNGDPPSSGITNPSSTETDQKSFDKAPSFSLNDYNGNTVELEDYTGTPLVINVWAAWCPFCREELPDFVSVQKEFEGKIVVIAIDRGESLSTAKGYTDELGISNDLIYLLDPDDKFYRSIDGFSMPETLFVDASGNILFHKRGFMDLNEMRSRIQEII